MKARILVYGGGFLVVLILIISIRWFASNRPWDVLYTPTEINTIVAFGDSLTKGVGSTAGNDYVSLLSNRLGIHIINHGVSGDTTRQGLLRIDEVLAEDPDVVILLLGANDALKRKKQKDTDKNLRTIIEILQNENIFVVFLGVRGGLIGDPYKDMYKNIARDFNLLFVPNILEGILTNSELTADQIHPNDAGYQIVADRIYAVIDQYSK